MISKISDGICYKLLKKQTKDRVPWK